METNIINDQNLLSSTEQTNIINDQNLVSSRVQGEVCKYAANQHSSSLNALSNKINDDGITKPP